MDVVLEINAAMVLRKWLDDRIEQYQALIGPLPPLPPQGEIAAKKSAKGKEKNKCLRQLVQT
jgi:hypothetical protein